MKIEDFSIPSFGRIESEFPDGTKYVIPCATSESSISTNIDKAITQYDASKCMD